MIFLKLLPYYGCVCSSQFFLTLYFPPFWLNFNLLLPTILACSCYILTFCNFFFLCLVFIAFSPLVSADIPWYILMYLFGDPSYSTCTILRMYTLACSLFVFFIVSKWSNFLTQPRMFPVEPEGIRRHFRYTLLTGVQDFQVCTILQWNAILVPQQNCIQLEIL